MTRAITAKTAENLIFIWNLGVFSDSCSVSFVSQMEVGVFQLSRKCLNDFCGIRGGPP